MTLALITEQDVSSPSRCDVVACDLCGGHNTTMVLTAPDRNWSMHAGEHLAGSPRGRTYPPSAGQTWKLVKCDVCDLTFLNPRPSAVALGQHYPGDYYAFSPAAAPARAGVTIKQRLRRFLRSQRGLFAALQRTPLASRLHDPITRVVGWMPTGRVLDVGCGSGEALNDLADLGWETWGVELDPKAAARATNSGHRMWTGSLENCDVPDASVDVVRMVHVLEHVPSPTETLTAIRRVLRPGGLLLIEVPNISHVLSAAFRDYSWSVDLPRHFYHFSPETLPKVVKNVGLNVQRVETIANPRYLIQSVHLALMDQTGFGSKLGLSDEAWDARRDAELLESLRPFCRILEARGQGSSIRLVAKRD